MSSSWGGVLWGITFNCATLNYMDKKTREMIRLRMSGWTYIRIGNRFGIALQNVHAKIRRATTNKEDLPKYLHNKSSDGRGRTRMLVRKRDDFTCQLCRDRRTPEQAKEHGKRLFDVHHLNGMCGKKSRGYDRVKDMSGLITLCHKCHFNRHDWNPT